MPMQLTVTRNRKTSENYNSEGYGISLSVELDQSLLTKPAELQEKVGYLYAEAEAALEQQANGTNGKSHQNRSNGTRGNQNGNGDSHRNGGGNGRTMTTSQRRAIDAIAKRLGIDATEEIHHEFGLNLDDLSVRQASQAIDHLKSLDQQPAGRNGGGR